MRQWLLNVAKAVLPDRFIEWYRRQRAARRYIEALGYEIYDREVRLELEDLEGRVAARRAGFSDRIVKDILERTDVVLQGLDRKIEGTSARHGRALRELEAQVEAVRADLERLSAQLQAALAAGESLGGPGPAPQAEPDRAPEAAPQAALEAAPQPAPGPAPESVRAPVHLD